MACCVRPRVLGYEAVDVAPCVVILRAGIYKPPSIAPRKGGGRVEQRPTMIGVMDLLISHYLTSIALFYVIWVFIGVWERPLGKGKEQPVSNQFQYDLFHFISRHAPPRRHIDGTQQRPE